MFWKANFQKEKLFKNFGEPEASTTTFHKYFSASYETATLYSCADSSVLGCWPPLIQNNDLECWRFSSFEGGELMGGERGRRRENSREKRTKSVSKSGTDVASRLDILLDEPFNRFFSLPKLPLTARGFLSPPTT
jgi:hypothetical protein